jgi:type II secretory pathway pseudopilin PulG
LIVLVIVGVLTTLAVTQYGSVRERTLSREAIANLKLIAAAERIYNMEQGFFYPITAAGGPASEDSWTIINNNLRLYINERNWDYAVSTLTVNGFEAAADRQGNGGYLDCEYKLNKNTPEDEPVAVVPAKCAQ